MLVYPSVFQEVKAGNSPQECDDAFRPEGDDDREGDELRFAVADGATDGFLSGLWADTLVQAFVDHRSDPCHSLWWAYNRWRKREAQYLEARAARGAPLQWYEEPKLALGAYAAFVGLVLTSAGSRDRRWRAVALGDCCMFHVRERELVRSFPIKHSSQFSYSPPLVPSHPPASPGLLFKHLEEDEGRWQFEDVFYLASDALAQWCLHSEEVGEPVWPIFQDLGTAEGIAFDALVERLRSAGRMKNDDVTLMRIVLSRPATDS